MAQIKRYYCCSIQKLAEFYQSHESLRFVLVYHRLLTKCIQKRHVVADKLRSAQITAHLVISF